MEVYFSKTLHAAAVIEFTMYVVTAEFEQFRLFWVLLIGVRFFPFSFRGRGGHDGNQKNAPSPQNLSHSFFANLIIRLGVPLNNLLLSSASVGNRVKGLTTRSFYDI